MNSPRQTVEALVLLLQEDELEVPNADAGQLPGVIPIEEILARGLLHLALEEREQVGGIQVDLEGLPASRVALERFGNDIRLARGCRERRQQILVGAHVVDDRPRLEHARPVTAKQAGEHMVFQEA